MPRIGASCIHADMVQLHSLRDWFAEVFVNESVRLKYFAVDPESPITPIGSSLNPDPAIGFWINDYAFAEAFEC